jgi:hypothetical protein
MTSSDAHDPVLQNLALLRELALDPVRAERVRARCRAQLIRNRRSEFAAEIGAFALRILTPVVVGCLCILYMAGLVAAALRLHGLLE